MLNNRLTQWLQQNVIAVLLPVWLIWLAAAFYYLASNDLVFFDPNDDLASISKDVTFDTDVVAYFNKQSLSTKSQVYHLLDDNCRCNSISEDHRQGLDAGTFTDAGYETQILSYQPFSNLIPSSPAVVIFNDNDQLVYMGPYSAGLSCDSSNSFVERVFNYSLISEYLGAVIVHEAKGCYCQNTDNI